ncbi:MAG TPA: lysophospholipid acyltransferase family protein [Flavobacteriales bacterium]|nr:lysophospholipid acyltransferase family protein [Flavobacteriales bacterium]
MFYVKAPFRALYKIYFGIAFFGTLLVQFPVYYLLTRWEKTSSAVSWMHRYIWSPSLQLLLLVWVHKKRKIKFPDGPFIICPNHTSYHDIIFMSQAIKGFYIFMGKAELKKWPLMKVFFKNGKYNIAVNRKSALEASRSLELARKRIKEGKSIVIFPEGTIPDNAPHLNKFKSGAFKLAIETGIPVIPVTFLDNWALMSDPMQIFGPCRPGISRVIVHDPIETKGMTEKDIVPLQDRVFNIIENDLKQYVYPRLKK